MHLKLGTKQLCKHFIDLFHLLLLHDVEYGVSSTMILKEPLGRQGLV